MKTRFLMMLGVAILVAGSATAGTAYYGGFTGETGIPEPKPTLVLPAYFTWIGNNDGTYTVDTNAGRQKGAFMLDDGVTKMSIPTGSAYSVEAAVIVPASGTFVDSASATASKRFFCGPEFIAGNGGGGDQCGVAGIEFRSSANMWTGGTEPGDDKWHLGSDNGSVIPGFPSEVDPGSVINLVAGDLFQTRVTKNSDGSVLWQYRVNSGSWTNYPCVVAQPVPAATMLGAGLDDAAADYMRYSIRGPWASIDPIAYGTGVPDVNITQDFDSDGAPNALEAVNGTLYNDTDTDNDTLLDGVETNTGTFVGAGNTGTDPLATDSDGDGLDDNVETGTGTFVGPTNTGSDPNVADSDGDGTSDGDEVAAATDPNVPDVPVAPMPVLAFPVALAMLAAGALATRRLRKK